MVHVFGRRTPGSSHRSPSSAFDEMVPAVPPRSVQAGETGGSNLSDLTDEHGGRTRMFRQRSADLVPDLDGITDQHTAEREQAAAAAAAAAAEVRGDVLDAEVVVVGPATAATNNPAGGRNCRNGVTANGTGDRRRRGQPDLMDDDSSEDSALQRQLSLGLTAARPEVAMRAGVMERMPTDVHELLRRAQIQPGLAPPAWGNPPLVGGEGGTGPTALGGPNSASAGPGPGGTLLPPPPPLASALRSSRGRGGERRNIPHSRGGLSDPFLSDRMLDDGPIAANTGTSNPLQTVPDASCGRGNQSSSTLGSSSMPSTGDLNLLERTVPNPPTPTGPTGLPTRSRSMGLGPSQFPAPLGKDTYRRSTTDESSNRPLCNLAGGRSTVTFTDVDFVGTAAARGNRTSVSSLTSRPAQRPPPIAITSSVSAGAAHNTSIDSMSREERDRLLRTLLSAQREPQRQPQQEESTSSKSSSEERRPGLGLVPERGDGQRQPGAVSVPVPARDATANVLAAGGDSNSIDPAIIEMLRRQEEAALQLSLAETRGPASNSGAAESARAAMSESDDQMLSRALELSVKETSSRRITNDAEDTDRELRRVLELSRKEVGGRPLPSSSADDEDEEMKMALNISLQDTGGRQYLRDGPRSSFYSANKPYGAMALGEGAPRQTSTGVTTQETVTVSGAGVQAVNGVYLLSGTCNSVNMYSRKKKWQGRDAMFTLYRCFLEPEANAEDDIGTPRLWFISIVPPDVKPGTDEDHDFYVARGTTNTADVPKEKPPESGWAPVEPFGVGSSPTCKWEPPSANVPEAVRATATMERVPEVQVYAAGSEQVNGVYKAEATDSPSAEVSTFVNELTWKGEALRIYLFRSPEDEDDSDEDVARRWFLSIVPEGCLPGSSADTDLYIADEKPGHERKTRDGRYILPPAERWKTIRGFGLDPPPVCLPSEDDLLRSTPSAAPAAPAAAAATSPMSPISRPKSSGTLSDMDGSGGPTSCSRGHSPYLRVTDENNETHTRKVAMCIVCRSRRVTHILVPCGHPCLCEECADYRKLENMNWQCPIGRCHVERVMRFYGTLVEDKQSQKTLDKRNT